MPNWCYNEMTISAEGEDAEKQLEEFKQISIKVEEKKNDNGDKYTEENLTFQGVVPRPSSLNITSGSSVSDAISYLKHLDGDSEEIKGMFNRTWMTEGPDKLFDKESSESDKIKAIAKWLEDKLEVNDLTEARVAMENVKKHGHKDWYWWSVDNWGTKWDAVTTNYDYDHQWLQVCFDTAWSPPEPWIKEVSKKFPLLEITVRVTEESDAYMGYICAINGEINCSFAEPHMPN